MDGATSSFVQCVLREALAAEKAKEDYMRRHMAGETEQARADLARLAIVSPYFDCACLGLRLAEVPASRRHC
jgi:hypothetical protein